MDTYLAINLYVTKCSAIKPTKIKQSNIVSISDAELNLGESDKSLITRNILVNFSHSGVLQIYININVHLMWRFIMSTYLHELMSLVSFVWLFVCSSNIGGVWAGWRYVPLDDLVLNSKAEQTIR